MLTKQEIYDTVRTHLLTQMKHSRQESTNTESLCLYRSPDGLKCAIGILISDEDYVPEMEGNLFSLMEIVARTNLNPNNDHTIYALIEDLQGIHDWNEIDDWEEELDDIKRKYNLC